MKKHENFPLRLIAFLLLSIALSFCSCQSPSHAGKRGIPGSNTPQKVQKSSSAPDYAASSSSKKTVQGDCAFIDGECSYGNAPYSTMQDHRRMVSAGGHIYWGLDELSCTDLEGNDRKVLWSEPVGQVSFYDGWVYFSDCFYMNNEFFESTQLYRIKPDGGTPQLVYQCEDINSDSFNEFLITNNSIYLAGQYGVKSVNIDGQNGRVLTRNSVWCIQVDGNRIYYCSDALWSSDLNGLNKTTLVKDNSRLSFEYQGWIYYYSDQDSSIYRISTDGTQNQLVAGNIAGDAEGMFVVGDELYFYYMNRNEPKSVSYDLERKPITGGGPQQVLCNDVMRPKYSDLEPIVINNYIYYETSDCEADTFCDVNRINLDGSNKIVRIFTKKASH